MNDDNGCDCPACKGLRELLELMEEVRKLRAFAQGVMAAWPLGDVGGGELQELALRHGLLAPEQRTEPCGEGCNCVEYWSAAEFAEGQICYRRTALLKGDSV